MEVGLGPGDFVLDGDTAPHSPKRRRFFGPCLLWPNGWMDQDGTWHGGVPRSRLHCARWEPSSPTQNGQSPHPQFSGMTCLYGQTAGWNKMPLGMEVGLGPGDIVLDEAQLPSPENRAQPPLPHSIFGPCLLCNLWSNGWMDQYATWYGGNPRPRRRCVRWRRSTP